MEKDIYDNFEAVDSYEGFHCSKNTIEEWIAALVQGRTPQGNRNIKVVLETKISKNSRGVVTNDLAHSKNPSFFVEYAGEKPQIKKVGLNYFWLEADNSIVYVANVNGVRSQILLPSGRTMLGAEGGVILGRTVHIYGKDLCYKYEAAMLATHPKEAVVTEVSKDTISKIATSLKIDAPSAEKFVKTVGNEQIALRGVSWLLYALQTLTREDITSLTNAALAAKGVRLPPDKEKRKSIIKAAKLAAKLGDHE